MYIYIYGLIDKGGWRIGKMLSFDMDLYNLKWLINKDLDNKLKMG